MMKSLSFSDRIHYRTITLSLEAVFDNVYEHRNYNKTEAVQLPAVRQFVLLYYLGAEHRSYRLYPQDKFYRHLIYNPDSCRNNLRPDARTYQNPK